MDDFNERLQKHLWKSELEYRAKMLPNGSEVDWLAPYCGDVKSIASFLRSVGFQIKEITDITDDWDKSQWVVTTSSIIVYVNDKYCNGFIAASACKNKR